MLLGPWASDQCLHGLCYAYKPSQSQRQWELISKTWMTWLICWFTKWKHILDYLHDVCIFTGSRIIYEYNGWPWPCISWSVEKSVLSPQILSGLQGLCTISLQIRLMGNYGWISSRKTFGSKRKTMKISERRNPVVVVTYAQLRRKIISTQNGTHLHPPSYSLASSKRRAHFASSNTLWSVTLGRQNPDFLYDLPDASLGL